MAAPISCVYCREPSALHRDTYVLLPSEHPAGGDYQPAHLACMEASTRDINAHPTDRGREPICQPFKTVYLIHRAAYRFALAIPRTVPSSVRRGLAFFRLWLTGQAPQDGVVLTLRELTTFYEDLGRILEFIGHERYARLRSHPPPGDGGARP